MKSGKKKRHFTFCLLLCLLLCMTPTVTEAKTKPLKISPQTSAYRFKKGYSSSQKAARKKVIAVAKSYLNTKEKSAKHKKIIKLYNGIKKNMYRGRYMHLTATTSMSWCDIFVCAMFQQANLKKAIEYECGCEEHIRLLQKNHCWVENDAYVPSTGDLIFYDWSDTGRGDNHGWSTHVGFVVGVKNNIITTIEGNYQDTVKYRAIKVNGRYIRGFGIPKY